MLKRGLVLMVGGAGAGKSTTLAAMINYRNETSSDHILTIEDPIEFLHSNKKSIVNQREVGLDTKSFARALRSAVRAAPDVILVGEIRDRETMESAIALAGTGHLCIATLHANNCAEALVTGQSVQMMGGGGPAAVASKAVVAVAATKLFDDKYKLLDTKTGQPLSQTDYAVKRATGETEHGTTDDEGRTHLLTSVAASEHIQLFILEE